MVKKSKALRCVASAVDGPKFVYHPAVDDYITTYRRQHYLLGSSAGHGESEPYHTTANSSDSTAHPEQLNLRNAVEPGEVDNRETELRIKEEYAPCVTRTEEAVGLGADLPATHSIRGGSCSHQGMARARARQMAAPASSSRASFLPRLGPSPRRSSASVHPVPESRTFRTSMVCVHDK